MSEDLVISVLIIFVTLFIVTNFFWLYHYNKLLNKFMSRNYAEFVQAEQIAKMEPLTSPSEDVPDPLDQQRARELNQLIGVG